MNCAVSLTKATRLPVIPVWAVGAVFIWLAGVAAWHFIKIDAHANPSLCLFRTVTGIPCPTCGSTRATVSLLDGHIASALQYNPFVLLTGVAVLFYLTLRSGFGRVITVRASRSSRRKVWLILGFLFLVNWAYVIVTQAPHLTG